ncbi:hypothetical protein JHK85_000717 [Glycine max]|nr:hypothetical protein JHK85_000717 [Glycine max]
MLFCVITDYGNLSTIALSLKDPVSVKERRERFLQAMKSLCESHNDIWTLMTALELPVSDWEDKWIDVYFDITSKLLDICNAFSSELSRLNQGNLPLKCALHNLDYILVSKAAKILTKFVSADNGASLVINAYLHRASASFNELKQLHKELGSSHSHKKHKRHITENGNDSGIISLDLPKVKNPAKGKVLMQAMYGVKVETLEAVDASVKILYPTIQAGVDIVEIEWLVKTVEELRAGVEKLSQGNDLLAKGVDGLFEAAMTSRDTLLSFVRFDKIVNDRSPGRNRDMQVVH